MPNQTNSKRLSLSVAPDLHKVLTDLAKLQKKPKSRIIVEILEEALPTLIQFRDALEQVSKGADAQTVANSLLESAMVQIQQKKEDMK